MSNFSIVSKGLDDTSKIAKSIAPILSLGNVVILKGALGSGKTYFVKALAKALGSTNDVTSPTYTIANFYNINIGQFLHIDAYRLSNLAEFRDLGLTEFLPESITVIEWGEKLARDFPDYLLIQLDFVKADDNHRNLLFSFEGEYWSSNGTVLQKKLSDFQE